MRRIIYDVPRWHVFLHREARGLPPVENSDPAERRFEDELYQKLYAGEAELLDERDRDAALSTWAEKVHGACDQLPNFARLAGECRGDESAAATALEKILDDLRPQMQRPEVADAPALRRAMRTACERASAAIEELRDTTEGLDQVAFGSGPGRGTVKGESRPSSSTRTLARRIRDDHRLRRIALLAGRFKRIAAAKQRQKVKHGADEIADVEQGADLGRLLPAELARFVHPKLRLSMLRDLTERRCLQYQLTGTEVRGKGPLVVCLDKSGSMDGPPDVWSTAVALALLDVAQRERRPFALLGFDEGIKHEALVKVGEQLPEVELFVTCGGGTDIANVVSRGLDIIEQNPGAMRKADVVIITDGGSATDRAPSLRARAAALGVTILGFGIGVEPGSLAPWCDEAHGITDLDRIDEKSANALFGGD